MQAWSFDLTQLKHSIRAPLICCILVMLGSSACNEIMYFVPLCYIQIQAELDVSPRNYVAPSFVVCFKDNGLYDTKTSTCRECQSWCALHVEVFALFFAMVYISNKKNVEQCGWVKTHPAQLGYEYNTMGRKTWFQNMRLNQILTRRIWIIYDMTTWILPQSSLPVQQDV